VTVGEALALARSRGLERLDARSLLGHVLGWPPARVVANDDALLDGALEAAFLDGVARRAAGVPLAQIVGEKEFHGLLFEITADVLVPRPETELLVDWALEALEARAAAPGAAAVGPVSVVDLGTGSGAIAVALAVGVRRLGLDLCPVAVDTSEAALAVARRNAARHGVGLDARRGDWWAALGDARADLAVSNPPYIASGVPDRAA